MTTTAPAFDVRPYRPGDESQVLGLLHASLDGGPTGQRSAEFLRWKHEHNPFGQSLALVADAGGTVIGFRSLMRWRLRAGDTPVHAVRAVDTATHPSHQGKGVFTRLTLAAVEELRGNTALIFNTPNRQSLPGYLKMGWSQVGVVRVAIRVVRPVAFLRGLPRATRGAPSGPPAACSLPPARQALHDQRQVDDLLVEAATPGSRLTTDRTTDYLRWRYGDAPGLDYRAITVHDGARLAGLAIARPRRRGTLNELILAEVIVRRGDGRTARRLLRAAARAGVDHVATHLSDPGLVAAARRVGYLALPGQGMRLVARPLADVRPDPLAVRSWRLSLGDLEAL